MRNWLHLNLPLWIYLSAIDVMVFLSRLWDAPLRRILSLNYRQYLRDIKERPDLHNDIPEKFIEKHPYTPRKLMRFRYWGVIKYYMHGVNGSYLTCPETLQTMSLLMAAKTMRNFIPSMVDVPLCIDIALSALRLNEEAQKHVRSAYGRKKYKYWMAEIQAQIDSEHPYVELLRYSLLCGDITPSKYLHVFDMATQLDKTITPGLKEDITYTFIPPLSPREVVNQPLRNNYLTMFGDQWETPFKAGYAEGENTNG